MRRMDLMKNRREVGGEPMVNAIKLRDIVGWVERERNPPLL